MFNRKNYEDFIRGNAPECPWSSSFPPLSHFLAMLEQFLRKKCVIFAELCSILLLILQLTICDTSTYRNIGDFESIRLQINPMFLSQFTLCWCEFLSCNCSLKLMDGWFLKFGAVFGRTHLLLQSADTGRCFFVNCLGIWYCRWWQVKFDVNLRRKFKYSVVDTKRALGVVNVTLAEPGRFR